MCMCVCTRVCTCVLEHRTAIFNFLIHQRDTAARPWTKRIPGTRIEWLNNSSPTSFSFFLFFFVFFLIHRTLLLLIFIRRGEEFHFYAVHHANSVFAKVENVIGMGWIFLFFSFFFFLRIITRCILEWKERNKKEKTRHRSSVRDRKFRRDELVVCISTGSPKDTHYT